MRRLRMRPSAMQDLQDIFDFLADAAGEPVARRFTGELEAQCRKLASFSGTIGRARPELRRDVRSFPFRNYIIFFRYVDDALEVVNVVEGHRDLDAFFARKRDE